MPCLVPSFSMSSSFYRSWILDSGLWTEGVSFRSSSRHCESVGGVLRWWWTSWGGRRFSYLSLDWDDNMNRWSFNTLSPHTISSTLCSCTPQLHHLYVFSTPSIMAFLPFGISEWRSIAVIWWSWCMMTATMVMLLPSWSSYRTNSMQQLKSPNESPNLKTSRPPAPPKSRP